MGALKSMDIVKLKRPTDFLILEAFAEEGRNVAANIAILIDKKRSYVNTRLPELEGYRLLQRVGPSPNSGLYEITDRGRAALELRSEYSRDPKFEQMVDERAQEIRGRP